MTGRNVNTVESPYEDLKNFTGKSLVVKTQYDYISFGATMKYRDIIPNSTMITVNEVGHSVDPGHVLEFWKNIEMFIANGTTINPPYYGNTSPWS